MRVLRFVVIVVWVVAGLWVVRTTGWLHPNDPNDDTQDIDVPTLVEELEELGGG